MSYPSTTDTVGSSPVENVKRRLSDRDPRHLSDYGTGGSTIIGVGIVSGIVSYGYSIVPWWAGFAAGSGTMLILLALAYANHDAHQR